MIAELLTFFALLSLAVTALIVLVPGVVRARLWLGLPLGAAAAAGAAATLLWLTGDVSAAEFLLVWAVLVGIVARVLLERWSYLASLLLASVLLAGVAYLVYSVLAAVVDPLGPIIWVGTVLLLLFEVVALGLSLS
ncbi:MAG TPA: hypothetical protein VKF59_09465, partial [Candidatus Dormibacteraeota bacterium]|nr:hypothetical protein [Candidatus Dormibacteraeota bacterium]